VKRLKEQLFDFTLGLLLLVAVVAVSTLVAAGESPKEVWAYCEDTEKGRADLERLHPTLYLEDHRPYRELMADRAVDCYDHRPFLPPRLAEMTGTYKTVERPDGVCYELVRLTTVSGERIISWRACRGQPT
jgi:hypothetical protein